MRGEKVHSAADIFPLMDAQQFADLKADIERNGLREPIVYFDGEILDGRNRAKACKELGVKPDEVELEECDDPIAYVLSANLHRRHLDQTQRAIAAAKAENFYAREAKERQREAGKVHGRGREKVPENLPEANRGDSRDAAGQAFGVSGRSVDHAKTVLNNGSKALQKAVENGEVKVSRAAAIAKTFPKPQQIEAAKAKPASKPKQQPNLAEQYNRILSDCIVALLQVHDDYGGCQQMFKGSGWDKAAILDFSQQVKHLHSVTGKLRKEL